MNYIINSGFESRKYLLNGDTKDFSGNKCHATITGVLYNNSPNNRIGARFQRSTSYGLFASDANLPTGNNSRTITVWFKPESISANTEKWVIGYGKPGSMQQFYMLYTYGSEFRITQWGAAQAWATGLVANRWYFAAITNIGNTVYMFMNGKFEKSASISLNTQLSQIIIGNGTGSYNGNGFDGFIYDVRFYNRALNPNEILNLYYSTNPTRQRNFLNQLSILNTTNFFQGW